MCFHTTNLRWSDLFWRMHLHRGCTCSLIVWGWSQNLIAHNYLFFLIQWIFCTEEQNLSNVLVPDESAESARSSYNSGAGDQYRVEERRLVAVIVCQPWRPPLSVALYPITTKLCPLSDYLVDAVHSYGSALVLIHPFKQFIFLEINIHSPPITLIPKCPVSKGCQIYDLSMLQNNFQMSFTELLTNLFLLTKTERVSTNSLRVINSSSLAYCRNVSPQRNSSGRLQNITV